MIIITIAKRYRLERPTTYVYQLIINAAYDRSGKALNWTQSWS